MADNTTFTPGTGGTLATDEIGGVHYQRVKITQGENGIATDVSSVAPLPVGIAATPAITVKRAAISAASSGDNTLVAAVVGSKIKVLGVVLIAAGAVNVRFESGAGGTALTGVMSMAAAGNGFVAPLTMPGYHHFETAVNTLLNLELSAAVQVSGWLVYYEEA